ncbi:hypothetical protein F5Y14DRAFT_459394 [Nemania sp. NC0429]|nr:hypothetical protein F5Y14DRAFT_459394 [Nemania sp. NC0429]
MSCETYTSPTGAPPSDLRPAPLRIPLRKSVASSLDDDPVTVSTQHRDVHQTNSDNITRGLSHRRGRDSKLESLVSRFEILDAANSANTSLPQHLDSTYEAGVAVSKQSHNPPAKSILNRDPSELCPRQTVLSTTFQYKSMLPVNITTSGGVSAHRLPKYRSLRKNIPPPHQPSPASAISLQPTTKPLTSKKALDGQEAKDTPSKPSNDLKLSETVSPKQRLSAGEPSGQPARLSFQSKSSYHSARQSQDMPLFASSKRIPELLIEGPPMPPTGTSYQHPSLDGTREVANMKPEDEATEKLPPLSFENIPLLDSPSLQDARQEQTRILHDSGRLEPSSLPANEKTIQDWGNSMNSNISTDGLGSTLFDKQAGDTALAGEDASRQSPFRILRVPKALSPRSRAAHGSGKVSQLRKIFERSSKRFSSPRSLMRLRSRLSSEELADDLTGNDAPSSWDESDSPLSTQTISVNDFFCEFVGGLDHEETTIAASPSETAAEVVSQKRRESPVKHRIQQFEHLSRDSLNTKGGSKRTMGVAIWRKISSSLTFNRSIDSRKDDNSEHEPINPTNETSPRSNTSVDRIPPPAGGGGDARPLFRHSSSFGYSMYRVSHKSRQFVSSQTAPDIHADAGDVSNKPPKRTRNASNGHSSPSTPRFLNSSFPILTRVSSGFRQPNWFGLDGHSPSKPVPEEELVSSEATVSGPSTPHNEPNTLLKAMLKQSAAERSRRRHDQKQLHRDKKLRAFARWSERRRAHADPHYSADSMKGKGKGKEKDTAEKAPQRDGGQQSSSEAGENETNKKTESGFVIFESKNVKLRHPRPRRPGQVRKVANLYRDKGSSGLSVNTKASSGTTLKESRQSFRRKASSALGLRSRRGDDAAR